MEPITSRGHRHPYLPKEFPISITFKDASGAPLSTVSDTATSINPCEKIVVGMAYTARHLNVASITISTLRDSSVNQPPRELQEHG